MGAVVAPALTSATRSLMDFAFEIPNIEIGLTGVEDENEMRSLVASQDWSRVLSNVVNNLAEEFNSKYKGKLPVYLHAMENE